MSNVVPGKATTDSSSYSWPQCAANWKAARAGEPTRWSAEYPIHTDSWTTGGIDGGLGPYQYINALAIREKHESHLYPAVILRVDWHLPEDALKPNLARSEFDRYHAGYVEDEMAALLGLQLGIRARAGATSRQFDPEGDPKGRPSAGHFKRIPPIPYPRLGRRILPWASRDHYLNAAVNPTFERLHTLQYEDAAAIVKAARLHQEALWIAESAPEMAWLLLVTAVETAASHWRRASVSPIDWLSDRKPRLRALFKGEGRDDLFQAVADELANLVGATAQFRGFLQSFCPPPPSERPQECYQHAWDRESLRKTFNVIYKRRSDFVHSGIPFPAMMCMQPWPDEKNRKLYAEKPLGKAMATQGASWKQADAPMQLHIFEYIVRGALLEWWKWCLPGTPYLNAAARAELEQIPGIGPKQAERIASHRILHGEFESFDDLLTVAGIGQKTVDAIQACTTLAKK